MIRNVLLIYIMYCILRKDISRVYVTSGITKRATYKRFSTEIKCPTVKIPTVSIAKNKKRKKLFLKNPFCYYLQINNKKYRAIIDKLRETIFDTCVL